MSFLLKLPPTTVIYPKSVSYTPSAAEPNRAGVQNTRNELNFFPMSVNNKCIKNLAPIKNHKILCSILLIVRAIKKSFENYPSSFHNNWTVSLQLCSFIWLGTIWGFQLLTPFDVHIESPDWINFISQLYFFYECSISYMHPLQ